MVGKYFIIKHVKHQRSVKIKFPSMRKLSFYKNCIENGNNVTLLLTEEGFKLNIVVALLHGPKDVCAGYSPCFTLCVPLNELCL